MEKIKAADEISRIAKKIHENLSNNPDRAASAVASITLVVPHIHYLETERFRAAGKNNKGKISLIRQAINFACSNIESPNVKLVIDYLAVNSRDQYEYGNDDFEDDDVKNISYILQEEIGIKVQQIDWDSKELLYRTKHGKEKTICFATVDNYIRDYKGK